LLCQTAVNLTTFGQPQNTTTNIFHITIKPDSALSLFSQFRKLFEMFQFLGAFPESQFIPGFQKHGGDICTDVIHKEMTVIDQLARLGSTFCQTHTKYNIVQPKFKRLEKVQTCQPTAALRIVEVSSELSFEDAINPACPLLGSQLAGVIRFPFAATLAGTTMHPGCKSTLLESALGAEASRTLQK
jgi:hypothetical protein